MKQPHDVSEQRLQVLKALQDKLNATLDYALEHPSEMKEALEALDDPELWEETARDIGYDPSQDYIPQLN